jgi:hypothetical protein
MLLALLVISKERSSSNVLGRAILKVLWSTGYRVLKGADIARKTLWRLRRRMTTVESGSSGEEVEAVMSGSELEKRDVEDGAEAERGAAGASGWFSMTSFFRPRLLSLLY